MYVVLRIKRIVGEGLIQKNSNSAKLKFVLEVLQGIKLTDDLIYKVGNNYVVMSLLGCCIQFLYNPNKYVKWAIFRIQEKNICIYTNLYKWNHPY